MKSYLNRAWAGAGLLLLLLSTSALAQMSVEVVPLRYRTADELIPILRPMLPKDASISGLKGQLVVRTTPRNLGEIRRVLASLDVAPRRLLISVAHRTAGDDGAHGAQVSGSVRTGDHARIDVGERVTAGNGVHTRIYDSRSASNVNVLQTVQALEGRNALVQIEESRPVSEPQIARSMVGGRIVEHVVSSTGYRSASTGFVVTPRLAGERVTLDISPQREVFVAPGAGAVETQRVVTTVSGRLGEWIEVAAISEAQSSDREVILGRAGSHRVEARSVLLKVDELR